MVEVKEGMTIPIADVKAGESSHGPYWMIPVRAEKGYDKITLWAMNPTEAQHMIGSVKVKSIKAAKISGRKVNDKWYTDYELRAVLEQGEDRDQIEYKQAEISLDDDLPF